MRDEVTAAVDTHLKAHDAVWDFALELGRRRGWSMKPEEQHRRVLHMLAGTGGRVLPLVAAEVAAEVTGECVVSVVTMRAALKARVRGEPDSEPKRPGMARVRRLREARETG